jgi:hypothetical protein
MMRLPIASSAVLVVCVARASLAQTPSAQIPSETPSAAPSTQTADGSPRFGAQGQLALVGAYASVFSTQWGSSSASSFSASFGPSVNWFPIDDLSLGVDLELDYSDGKGYAADGSLVESKTTLVSGGPRLGYNLQLGRSVSFWPLLTVGVHFRHQTQQAVSGSSVAAGSATGSLDTTQNGPWATLWLPLLFHPAPHFFVGFGPRLYHDFAAERGGSGVGAELTTLGAGVGVGGWWGGRPREEPPSDAAFSGGTERRFGDPGNLVLTSEVGLGGGYSWYAATDSSAWSATVEPGLDYFAADHLSIGVVVTYTYSSAVGVGPTGTSVRADHGVYGIGGRLGVDLPLSPLFSVYPRALLTVGSDSWDERAGSSQNALTDTFIAAHISAPLLLHAAPHFFVGAGPQLTHDLSRTFQSGASNLGTTIGGSLLLGGWI